MNTMLIAAVVAVANVVAQSAQTSETNSVADIAPVVVEATRLGQTKEEVPSPPQMTMIGSRQRMPEERGQKPILLRIRPFPHSLTRQITGVSSMPEEKG